MGERLELPAACEPALRLALQAELQSADPFPAIVRALKLAAALEGTLESPTAARSIRRLLQSEPAAVKLIRTRMLAPKSIDASKAFARREGRGMPVRAPRFGERAPAGTTPLADLLVARRKRSRG